MCPTWPAKLLHSTANCSEILDLKFALTYSLKALLLMFPCPVHSHVRCCRWSIECPLRVTTPSMNPSFTPKCIWIWWCPTKWLKHSSSFSFLHRVACQSQGRSAALSADRPGIDLSVWAKETGNWPRTWGILTLTKWEAHKSDREQNQGGEVIRTFRWTYLLCKGECRELGKDPKMAIKAHQWVSGFSLLYDLI